MTMYAPLIFASILAGPFMHEARRYSGLRLYFSSIFCQVASQLLGFSFHHAITSRMHSAYWLSAGMHRRLASTIFKGSFSKNASAYIPPTNCPPYTPSP